MESVEVKLAAYILRWVRNRGGGSLGMVWNERGSFGVLQASAGYRFRLQVKRAPKMEPKWTPECQIHRKPFRQNRFRNSSNPWTKASRCVVAGSNAALCSLHQFWRFGRFWLQKWSPFTGKWRPEIQKWSLVKFFFKNRLEHPWANSLWNMSRNGPVAMKLQSFKGS